MRADEVDLLITDVAMPQMYGFALSEIIDALRPATPLLYMTGNPATVESLRQQRVRAHWSLLLKPFTPAQLLGRVGQIVKASGHTPSERSEGGGESGIRTHGRVAPTHAFQACSFNHSDISPWGWAPAAKQSVAVSPVTAS